MRFMIKEKMFSFRDSFEVFSESGDVAFTAKSEFFSIRKRFFLRDQQQREIAKLSKKLLSIRPTFYAELENGVKMRVWKKFFSWFSSTFYVDFPGRQITVKGNFLQHDYMIEDNGRPIASISKTWLSWTDSYGVEVYEEQDLHWVLAIVIIIDATLHGSKNSNFGD